MIWPLSRARYWEIDAGGFFGGFVDKLEAEMAGAQGQEAGGVLGAGLGAGVKQCITAAGVGLERMLLADAVAQGGGVAVAGAAAVGVIGAVGEEGAEEAVLHVKHGDVLVKGDLEPGGRGRAQEGLQLEDVQIVGGGQAK